MSRMDWNGLIRVGLYELRLSVDEFWTLTPVEFMIKSGVHKAAGNCITRSELLDLMNRFPDKK